MPWQQDAIDVAYEFDPITGLFRYDEVDITVPRQSGKTTLELAKKVHRLTVMARKLGPQRSMYTAQTRLKARNKLEQDFAVTLRGARAFREVPHARARPTKATEWRLSLNNGSEHLQFGSGSFLQIDAPSRTGGHGDTLDDGTIDEAFSQEDDTVEAGMRPTMATRKNAQLWVVSTAGDKRSKYLWRKVRAGRAATEAGRHGRVCYIEYSAPEDADPGDPEVWAGCMPAVGHTIPLRFIEGEWDRAQRKGPEGINMFLRAYLNLWPEVPVLEEDQLAAIVPVELWRELRRPAGTPHQPVLSVEVALDRSHTWIGAAWMADGRRHVEVLEDRPDTAWVRDRIGELRCKYGIRTAVVDASSEAASLIPDIEAEGIEVLRVTGVERATACADFYDAAIEGHLTHDGDPAVLQALKNARWKDVGDGARVFSRRKSVGPIGELYAVTYALHGLTVETREGAPNIW